MLETKINEREIRMCVSIEQSLGAAALCILKLRCIREAFGEKRIMTSASAQNTIGASIGEYFQPENIVREHYIREMWEMAGIN